MTRVTSPFDWIGTTGLILLLIAAACAAMLAGHRLRELERGFPSGLVRSGVVLLAAPWSHERAEALYRQLRAESSEDDPGSWTKALRQHTYIDFWFAAAVTILLATICSALSRGLDGIEPRIASIVALVAWGVLAAFVFDSLENIGILWMLDGATSSPFPQLTTIASALKWTAYAGGMMAVLAGSLKLTLHVVSTVVNRVAGQ